jgi:hypothetical protein
MVERKWKFKIQDIVMDDVARHAGEIEGRYTKNGKPYYVLSVYGKRYLYTKQKMEKNFRKLVSVA